MQLALSESRKMKLVSILCRTWGESMKSISESESSSLVTLRLSKKDAKKKLKALKIMADVFVFIILEFIEPTLIK